MVRTNYIKIQDVGKLTICEVIFTADDFPSEKPWTYVKRGKFVAALVYNKTRECFVFVKQYRIALVENGDNPKMTEVIAGMHDQDSIELTLLKEIREEVGVNTHISLIEPAVSCYSSPGASSEFGHFYYVEIDNLEPPPQFGGVASEHEYLERVEFPITKTLKMLKHGEFIDSKTVLLLNWWLANRADWRTLQMYRGL